MKTVKNLTAAVLCASFALMGQSYGDTLQGDLPDIPNCLDEDVIVPGSTYRKAAVLRDLGKEFYQNSRGGYKTVLGLGFITTAFHGIVNCTYKARWPNWRVFSSVPFVNKSSFFKRMHLFQSARLMTLGYGFYLYMGGLYDFTQKSLDFSAGFKTAYSSRVTKMNRRAQQALYDNERYGTMGKKGEWIFPEDTEKYYRQSSLPSYLTWSMLKACCDIKRDTLWWRWGVTFDGSDFARFLNSPAPEVEPNFFDLH